MAKDQIRVLYIDDDRDDFFLINALLKKIPDTEYHLESATTIAEAMQKFDHHFDVFLVDYRLGKETGLALIKEIRKRKKHAPAIMLTGMNNVSLDREALLLGASDYLVKGQFDAFTLDRIIRYAIHGSQINENLELAGLKFRTIFERAGDPFLLIDSEGRILEANPVACSKFGSISPESKEEIFFENFILEKELKEMLITHLKSKSQIFEFEATLIDNTNKNFKGLVSIVKQNVNLFQVLIKDLSALKEKEEEELNLKKFSATGRIARLLAHEVKNPLTTILLSADQLQTELPEDILHESGELIEVIQRNCNRINQLVTQLLESTRFSELASTPQSINKLLMEALYLVEERISYKGIKVIKDFESEICDIEVDPEKVKIALVNLMTNAIEAMAEGEGVLQLRTFQKDKFCVVEIKDNGEGIPKENLERLFEPFFTSKGTGSGLGLTNTQNIILSHGGAIRVSSEVGKGTTFIVSFKLSDSK